MDDLAFRRGPFGSLLTRQDAVAENTAESSAADEDGDDSDEGYASTASATARRLLRKVVGARMVAARNLAGLRQGHAAEQLGYRTTAQICLWEKGQRIAPLPILIKAAALYGVPCDYLLGVSDQTERDAAMGLRAATVRGIRGVIDGLAEALTASIANHAALVGPNAGCARAVLSSGEALIESLGVLQRQPEFDDLKGGAAVVRTASEFEARLDEVRQAIDRFDRLDIDLRKTIATATAANDESDAG